MYTSLRHTFVNASLHILEINKVIKSRNNDVAKVIKALDLSPVNLALALIFLHRYHQNEVNTMDSSESENLPYYLMIASLILSNKYLNDQSYTLKLWLSILRKYLMLLSSLSLLNQMEVHMLAALNYQLTVDHDLLLWGKFNHLDTSCIHKLKVAAECEKPGAYLASSRPIKRALEVCATLTSIRKHAKVVSKNLDLNSIPTLQPQTPSNGLATPPSSQPSPTSYFNRRLRLHKKSLSAPSHSFPQVSLGFQQSFVHSVPSLPSGFMPALTHTSLTPSSTVCAVSNTGYSSVYATPCCVPMATFTPQTYTGAFTPANYSLGPIGGSFNFTPSIGGVPATPMSSAGSKGQFLVAHSYVNVGSPYYVQTPNKRHSNLGNMKNYGNINNNMSNMAVSSGNAYASYFEAV